MKPRKKAFSRKWPAFLLAAAVSFSLLPLSLSPALAASVVITDRSPLESEISKTNPSVDLWIDVDEPTLALYQWYDSNDDPISGATGNVITVTEPGEYYVLADIAGPAPDPARADFKVTLLLEVPIVKIVTQGGSLSAPAKTFTFSIDSGDPNNYGCEVESNTVNTNGAGTYDTETIQIRVPDMTAFNTLAKDGFFVKENSDGEAGWDYSDVEWYVRPYFGQLGPDYLIFAVNNGIPDVSAPVEKAVFTNTYTRNPASPARHTITVLDDGNGTGAANYTVAVFGTEIILTATPNAGFHFLGWEVVSGGVTITDSKFSMPNNDVTVKVFFEADTPPIIIENGDSPPLGPPEDDNPENDNPVPPPLVDSDIAAPPKTGDTDSLLLWLLLGGASLTGLVAVLRTKKRKEGCIE